MIVPKPLDEDPLSWINKFIAWLERGGLTEDSASGEGAAAAPSGLSTGMMVLHTLVPEGFLHANGSLVFNDQYPALGIVLGNTFGAAPAGMFKLPTGPAPIAGLLWIIKT